MAGCGYDNAFYKTNKEANSKNVNYYEHHYGIRRNCFKLNFLSKVRDSACNWHENIEVIFITEGQGYIKCGADTVKISEGEIFVINSEQMHHIYSDTVFSYYCLIIDESFCEDNGLDVKNSLFKRKISDKEAIKKYMTIVSLYKGKDINNYTTLDRVKIRMAILNFVVELYENHIYNGSNEERKNKAGEEYVKKAMVYINESYTNPIGLEQIAQVIGINKSYLSREFKKHAGHTVHTYINMLRCKKAEQCISEGMSVTDAAMECGFETLSYFSRTYKKIMKVSPSEIK